jgi:hypothetical protein
VENKVEPGRPEMTIWRMHIALWRHLRERGSHPDKRTNKITELYLLIFIFLENNRKNMED